MYDWHERAGTAYIASGVGYGKTKLSAFDAAELDANIISTNAVRVTSFIPPDWQITNNKEALIRFTDNAAFLPVAYAFAVSSSSSVAASLCIGINRDRTKASIIAEHADANVAGEDSLEQSQICVEEAFNRRNWEIGRLEKVVIEAAPRAELHVCALVAVVFMLDQ